jgi:hypothetical protein
MLLAWLITSAVMTLRSGRRNAAHTEHAEHVERQEQRRIRPTMPPAARAVTGAPRR